MRSVRIVFALLFFATGCVKDTQPLVLSRPSGCDSIQFSYTFDIKPLMTSRCSGHDCHSAGNDNYNYSVYAVLADRIRTGRLEERLLLPAGDPMHMPMGSSLSECDLFKLRAWIHQGFPNN